MKSYNTLHQNVFLGLLVGTVSDWLEWLNAYGVLKFTVWWRKNNEAVKAKGLDKPPVCITQHPGFSAVCLNRWGLQTVWYQYKQEYTDAYEGPDHKQKRHSLQAAGKVVLGTLGETNKSYSPFMCSLLHLGTLSTPKNWRWFCIWRILISLVW